MFWQSEPLGVPRFSFACILGTQILRLNAWYFGRFQLVARLLATQNLWLIPLTIAVVPLRCQPRLQLCLHRREVLGVEQCFHQPVELLRQFLPEWRRLLPVELLGQFPPKWPQEEQEHESHEPHSDQADAAEG